MLLSEIFVNPLELSDSEPFGTFRKLIVNRDEIWYNLISTVCTKGAVTKMTVWYDLISKRTSQNCAFLQHLHILI